MTPLFKKLNFKDHPHIVCVGAPESFNIELQAMESATEILLQSKGIKEIYFAIAFVQTQAQLNAAVKSLFPKLVGDAVLWFCYPKQSSKNYTSSINRDNGWEIVGDIGMEPVRAVAIDDDWSASRFRKVEYIKTMTRKFGALSAKGKERVEGKKKSASIK
jgi:hypothetical protein